MAGNGIRSGVVYCFRCVALDCDHAAPPDPRSVFTGYGPTGQPCWRDFAELLLDLKDERVDALFEDPPAILGRTQLGHDLTRRLLRHFGRGSRRPALLAQTVAGFFGQRRDGLFAVTIQAVAALDPGKDASLRLNVVGAAPDGRTAAEVFAAEGPPSFHAALHGSRDRILEIASALPQAGQDARGPLLRRVPGILQDLRIAFERGGRQRERRTRHAVERRADNRPTAAALSDVWSAGPEAVFRDEIRDTLIVTGPRGRAHAFTSDGRHVTSLRLTGDERAGRIARGRWRRASAGEFAALRSRLPSPDAPSS